MAPLKHSQAFSRSSTGEKRPQHRHTVHYIPLIHLHHGLKGEIMVNFASDFSIFCSRWTELVQMDDLERYRVEIAIEFGHLRPETVKSVNLAHLTRPQDTPGGDQGVAAAAKQAERREFRVVIVKV